MIFKANVIIPEYRSYSLLSRFSSDVELVHKDMDHLVNYLIKADIIDPKRTILLGRSLGGLFASKLSTKYSLGGLVLLSSFYSIREIVKGKVGEFLSSVVVEGEDTSDFIKINKNPTLIIHGQDDTLVKPNHAIMLEKACNTDCQLIMIEDMGHELESVFHELVTPISKFLQKIELI